MDSNSHRNSPRQSLNSHHISPPVAIIANATPRLNKWILDRILADSRLEAGSGGIIPVSELNVGSGIVPPSHIICLDGIFRHAYRAGIRPDVILGDLDSITKNDIRLAKELDIPVLSMPDQNHSDFAKGISYCLEKYPNTEIVIYNALGGDRLDHTLVNLGYLKRFFSKNRTIILVEKWQKTQFHSNEILMIRGPIGSDLAVMSMPKARVSSNGLLYDMKEAELEVGRFESSSNAMACSEAIIIIEGDCLVVLSHSQELMRE